MARYIDANKIDFSSIKDVSNRIIAKLIILNQPTADVEKVRHGRDVGNMNDRDDWYEPVHICSICDCGFMMDFEEEAHYCPNCGAKMEGGKAYVG